MSANLLHSRARSPLLSIDEILNARPQQPIATTRTRGWQGITVDLHRPYFGCAESYPGLDHHLICYCPSGSARLVQSRGGAVHRSVITAGTSYIMPAGYASSWEGDSGLSARLRVPVSLVASAAEQLNRGTGQVEIRNVFQVHDPVIERLAQSMLVELERDAHPVQVLIVDALSTALAAHLLRSYDAFERVACPNERSLGKLEIARLTEFIEDNLERTISLEDLASVVNVSRFHFTRLFKRSTGSTAISFVEQCRIRRAQALIVETDLPLAEIALSVGFVDQSHFTRRFHRRVGCTPAVFAREQGRRRSGSRSRQSSGKGPLGE
ncbi:AraC family transcriptional regulator [Paraburkholderia sp. DHOC27]|uniref:AraC family transcriptional regulator n=1 Tax=Paraburkholderia sp. DHOC27 TaxID=2303330 RepID=UPI000E3C560F|nr:AraC family transcriptional regulator [Paraburkholderia sp. DHOC27]RFU49719.1 AraC family transcriptional regulator [Paraburkholderia sp. DHOC27]